MATTSLYRQVRITPEAFLLLSRPVNGQGGYQDRLRRLQKAMGIEPDPSAMQTTPANGRIPNDWQAPNVEPATPSVPTFHAMSTDDPIVAAIQSKIDVMLAEVERLQGMLAGVTGASTPKPIKVRETRRQVARESDETIDVSDLDAVLRKAQRVRTEKATLHAAGRKRRSPKLSDAEREKRSKRMRAFWRKARRASK